VFHISIWDLGAFLGRQAPTATKLGPEQFNDEGAFEMAHEICD